MNNNKIKKIMIIIKNKLINCLRKSGKITIEKNLWKNNIRITTTTIIITIIITITGKQEGKHLLLFT